MFMMRFDMRAPATGAPAAELYATALDMAAWAETRGCVCVVLSEHHTSEDGYLPSPMILASAIAGRTSTLPIMVAVVLLPLYDPVRLAEEMAVLDIVSHGRVSYVAAIGYREIEYEMFGADFHRRGAVAEEKLELLLKAKTGDRIEHDGRNIHITPAPLTPGGPAISWGGGTAAAARRAGRHGIGFMAQGGGPELQEIYERSARDSGHEPVMCYIPSVDTHTTAFVAEDPERAWNELGPYLMHDVRSYAKWNVGRNDTASISFVATADELRAERRSHVIFTVEEAIVLVRDGSVLQLHPLIGGLPPDIAWTYLETVVEKVMPSVSP
jgi:alkanesulfonate monooxygenase SsuD/methylene tetrahydromethanopterin reductase-like flavin-dependent oxidoreductase (luciferase family)